MHVRAWECLAADLAADGPAVAADSAADDLVAAADLAAVAPEVVDSVAP